MLLAGLLSAGSLGWAAPGQTPAENVPLRASEHIDLHRLGQVSGEERAVLRVEWHAANAQIEEQQELQSMLAGLRRIETTLGEVNRLVRAIPPPGSRSQTSPVDDEPPSEPRPVWQLLLAGLTALGFLVLWLMRRKQPAVATAAPSPRGATPLPQSASPAALKTSPAAPASSSGITPKISPLLDAHLGQAGGKDETLELAEIMLSLGLAQGAAQTLVEHISNNPRAALFHWLKLLDIYRSSGHRSDFKQAAEQLRQHFNIQAEDWTAAGQNSLPSIEDYPRVAAQVEELWQQPAECAEYLLHLLNDNRGGTRIGFPQPVAEEILLLVKILRDGITDGSPSTT